ncbi:MAG: hypothetical protein R2699_02665 [Acidimicrobiales bacterium]
MSGEIVPVLNGSAFKNKGVQPLLDAIVAYLPSPIDLPADAGHEPARDETLERKLNDDQPFAALAFKMMTDPHVGKLTYFRVYSGTLDKGGQVLNARTQNKSASAASWRCTPTTARTSRSSTATSWRASGLQNTRTGDTLCDPSNPIVLEALEFPEPVIHVAVEPKTKADQDKMSKALAALSEEDKTFQVRTDEETGQTVISGMGQLHLEVIVDRMLREFKVDATVGKPRWPTAETIAARRGRSPTRTRSRPAAPAYRGGHGQPRADRPGRWLRVRRPDHRWPSPRYIPSVDAGIQEGDDLRRAVESCRQSTSVRPC